MIRCVNRFFSLWLTFPLQVFPLRMRLLFIFLTISLSTLLSVPYYEKIREAPEIPVHLPQVHNARLNNGIRIQYIENHAIPHASISILVHSGKFEETKDKAGLNTLWGESIVLSGSHKTPRDALAANLEEHASTFTFSGGLERSSFTLDALTNYFEQDLEMALEVLMNPRFATEDLELIRKQILQSMQNSFDSPSNVASAASDDYLCPDNVRGMRSRLSTVKTIEKEDLQTWQKKNKNAVRYTILLTGDFNKDNTIVLLNKYLGTMDSQGAVPPIAVQQACAIPGGKIWIAEKNVPQSTILMKAKGLPHGNNDYHAWKIFDFLLGGDSFTSVLTNRIRTQNGWAYTAYSYLSSDGYTGSAGIFTQTANANVPDVLHTIREILTERETFITEEEIARAKKSIRNRFVFIAETPSDYLALRNTLEWEGLPDNFLETFLERIDAATVEDVKRVARLYAPENFGIIVVGPASLSKKIDALVISVVP